MNRFGQFLLTGLFLMFIFVFGIYMVATPDNEESPVENRALAQVPDINVAGILNGTYMEEFESYVIDQFPARSKWLELYIDYQRFTNQTYIHDYYIAEDDWMLAEPEYEFPQEELDHTAERLNDFGAYLMEKDMEFYYFSVPHKVALMQFLLPERIKEGNYLENIQYLMNQLDEGKLTAVDMTNKFEKSFTEEEIKELYFKTDHHWTMEGAFTGYAEIVDQLSAHSAFFSETTVEKEAYEPKCMDKSKTFQGSYNRQIYMTVDASDENLCVLLPKDDMYANYEVTVDGNERDPFHLYGRGFHNDELTLVNYSDLFTYNHREINIVNPENEEAANKILIIKDSYANPIIYHIAEHFYETTVYDPRYNEDRTVHEFIEENDFDIVAMLYNSANLLGPTYNFDTYPVDSE